MAFTVIYSIKDIKAEGGLSTFAVNVPSTFTFAEVVDFAQQFAPLVDAVITGRINRVGLGYTVDISSLGLNATPADTSDVEEGAQFQFLTDGGHYTRFRIPTFDEALIPAGGSAVDITDADVLALTTAITTGIDINADGSVIVNGCDRRDEDCVALDYAREQFLSS